MTWSQLGFEHLLLSSSFIQFWLGWQTRSGEDRTASSLSEPQFPYQSDEKRTANLTKFCDEQVMCEKSGTKGTQQISVILSDLLSISHTRS